MRVSSPRAAPPRVPASRTHPRANIRRLGMAACLAAASFATLPAIGERSPDAAPPAAAIAPATVSEPAAPAEERVRRRPRPARTPLDPPQTPLPAPRTPPSPRPSPSAGAVGDTAPSPSTVPRSQPPEALTGYVWPVREARITTWFQHTRGGFVVLDVGRVHDGIDLATFCGDWVFAAHDGPVLYAGRKFDGYIGYNGSLDAFYAELERRELKLATLPIVVVIDDGNGYRSLYVHLREALVEPGDVVKAGQRIGREGATGHATGCHLHYSLIRMDGPFQAVAPELVDTWHYPRLLRERVDPMRVLSLEQDGAGTIVPGGEPPPRSPGYGPSEEMAPRARGSVRPKPVASPVPIDLPAADAGGPRARR